MTRFAAAVQAASRSRGRPVSSALRPSRCSNGFIHGLRAARGLPVLVLVLFVGCAPGGSSAGTDSAGGAEPPERFGFGSVASAERVAMWDIDVKPDGEGLPPGGGTVAEGERVYLAHCIACHGPTGTEGPNDVLVTRAPWEEWPAGRTVGGYWPYATTLYDYIVKAMPQLTPGILTADETYAVIAYILHLNDIVPEDAVMDARTLAAVEMPYRDRFVPDDRTGGSVIR